MSVEKNAQTRWRGDRLTSYRRVMSKLATVMSTLAGIILILTLLSILYMLLSKGIAALSLTVFTKPMGPPGSHSGLGNAILGSIIQTGLALLIAAPLGLLCGVYLSEYGSKTNRFATIVRFVSDVLMSVPSILVGLFIYQLLVAPFRHFSAFSGAVALAVLAVPVIIRTTEDMLRLVPTAMREAGAALGAAKWRVTFSLCLRSARQGVLTGVLLALARMGGETAPLLFTSLGNQSWSWDLSKPMASLPIAIYQYAGASYDDWVQLAWAGALIVTVGVLMINIVVRLSSRR
ncbi:phosphate ABC transporter permease PstA [Aristophania vespae]|uniref:Phosphate transport system permease protein PstA n=1 Tax=Aristophania vespae TaxID=2697033 RepID=A0A6P1N9D3_9PROT|nr:phosphate ABC transporter permease PstA [Aristophania vespae]QHI95026.1 phosphate ABC transporter permease PstA [Aristophania vespae]UMM64205.1 Phosphate transport system permease protein PstA [Aristophania vespae]